MVERGVLEVTAVAFHLAHSLVACAGLVLWGGHGVPFNRRKMLDIGIGRARVQSRKILDAGFGQVRAKREPWKDGSKHMQLMHVYTD